MAPPILLMGLIFWLGTDRASSVHTETFIEWLAVRLWRQPLPPAVLELANALFRKAGHFTGYLTLGLLDARAVEGTRDRLGRAEAGAAWTAAVAWAAVDEYHQSFSPSRSSSVWDVLLDACGAAAGVLIYHVWLLRHPRRP